MFASMFDSNVPIFVCKTSDFDSCWNHDKGESVLRPLPARFLRAGILAFAAGGMVEILLTGKYG